MTSGDDFLSPRSLSEFCKCPSLTCPVHACEQLSYVGRDAHNAATVQIGELTLLEGLQVEVAEKYVHAINRRALKLANRLPPINVLPVQRVTVDHERQVITFDSEEANGEQKAD